MSPVSYTFMESVGLPPGNYEMNGTVDIQDEGSLSIRVRGRFGRVWGTWPPPVGLVLPGGPERGLESTGQLGQSFASV